ncbi:MAG: helix-turn-helix domain-containing protein, partial [Mycobacteriales bacterium]
LDPLDLADLATAAGWALPARVAAVLCPAERAGGLAGTLGPGTLVGPDGDGTSLALVPDPDGPGRADWLRTALAGRAATVGPPVPLAAAHDSAAEARRARALQAAGTLPDDDPLEVARHRVTLLLHTDPPLVAALAGELLAPLAGLPPARRARLAETLAAWLAWRGERARVAAELHVHPQTVRYRVSQLRELFGPALEDPDTRFALQVVLRAGAHRTPSDG